MAARRIPRATPPSGRDGSESKAELLRKYRELIAKYRKLVERQRELAAGRGDVTVLALTAMRSGTSGLALVRDDRILVRNTHWQRLQGATAEWRSLEEGGASRRYDSLDDAALGEAKRVLFKRAPAIRTVRFEHWQGERLIEVRLERLGRPTEQPSVAVMVHDVTEQVRAERELARTRQAMFEQERMRAVGELASGVAHDLNNALHVTSLRLQRLRMSPAVMAEQGPNVEVLLRIVSDAATRVSRLQEFARQRQDQAYEAVDVGRVVADALELACSDLDQRSALAKQKVAVEVKVPDLPTVRGSPAELRHVFLNLIANACDAMPGGGRILVEGRREGDSIVVEVSDEGRGIPPEYLSRVFDPFFTTKGQRGTGLGLSVAYGVMRRLGGSVAAANRPEGGAVFRLQFPISAPPAAERPAAPPAGASPGHHILLVDDESDNLDAMEWVLESMGQDVVPAHNGREAVEQVQKQHFDLVLCDLVMPDMNGWEVAERIGATAPGTPIHLLSGLAQEIAPDDPRLRLVRGLLPKPLDLERLQRLLSEELGAHPSRDGGSGQGAAEASSESAPT